MFERKENIVKNEFVKVFFFFELGRIIMCYNWNIYLNISVICLWDGCISWNIIVSYDRFDCDKLVFEECVW